MKTLEQQLKTYYNGHSLPESKLETLLSEAAISRPSFFVRQKYWLAAATVVFLLGTALFCLFLQRQSELTEQVVAEIAIQHTQKIPVLEKPVRLDPTRPTITTLELPVISTQEGPFPGNLQLIGKGYGSIQGHPATRFRVKDRQSEAVYTLYVTPLTSELQTIKPGIREYEGIKVQLWNENGQFFGLAGESSNSQ